MEFDKTKGAPQAAGQKSHGQASFGASGYGQGGYVQAGFGQAGFGQAGAAQTGTGTPAAAAAQGGHIKDTTTQGFRQDVIAESMKQPVLVDFWAPWCGPCKQLTPVLEKVVNAAGGKVKLVKLNIDEHPAIPGQLGIQSIPAIIAFSKGQPVDGFMGALPESQLKTFIERLVGPMGPTPVEEILAEAAALAQVGDVTGAAELYGEILMQDPANLAALGAMAEIQVGLGDIEAAQRFLAMAPAGAALEIAQQASALGELQELTDRVEANPADHQARFDLALALNAKGRRDEAIDHLVAIVKRDRTWNEDGARKQILQFFEAWGPMDEATIAGRRKLSAVLFA
jgi:putative thioredoxin